jgi:hypothetical protein
LMMKKRRQCHRVDELRVYIIFVLLNDLMML